MVHDDDQDEHDDDVREHGIEAVQQQPHELRNHHGSVALATCWMRLAPAVRSASWGPASISSMDSAHSLPITPVLWQISASTLANGPSPTAVTKISANTMSGTARHGTEDGIPHANIDRIAEVLKPHGYVTGQFGKNHLGDKTNSCPPRTASTSSTATSTT